MIRIPYVAPKLDPENVARAAASVRSMQDLLSRLGKPIPFRVLSRADHATLRRSFDRTLVDNVVYLTEGQASTTTGSVEPVAAYTGLTDNAFDSSLYASGEVRRWLIESQVGRCAYCESLIAHSDYGRVSHFRPPGGLRDSAQGAIEWPGYYELAYTPANLYYACAVCEDGFKRDVFPVLGKRYPEISLADESPVLINPYTENPRDYIRFNPVNGCAYDFERTCEFYLDKGVEGHCNLGRPQTETLIFSNPAFIPDQRDQHGHRLSQSAVDKAFDSWLDSRASHARSYHGERTIEMLGLNRALLIRSRISHLRHLLGIYCIAASGDQQAVKLDKKLASGDPGAAALAPQYLSSTIDALSTWARTGTGMLLPPASGTWFSHYETAIASFPAGGELLPPPPVGDDWLMYAVLRQQSGHAGNRRVVTLSTSDAIYGHAGNSEILFFPIDWSTDLGRHVLVERSGSIVARTTLQELLASSPRTLWQTFNHTEVWVLGPFEPFSWPD